MIRKALVRGRSRPKPPPAAEGFFKIRTLAVLSLHRMPIGVLNVEGDFDPLLTLLDHAVAERFFRPEHLERIVLSDLPAMLAADLLGRTPPAPGPKWIGFDKT
ncbi:MAG: LOG family protein [Singulisphaera sp.]